MEGCIRTTSKQSSSHFKSPNDDSPAVSSAELAAVYACRSLDSNSCAFADLSALIFNQRLVLSHVAQRGQFVAAQLEDAGEVVVGVWDF